MRSSDQLFRQSDKPAVSTDSDTSFDETIARFLTTSAHYFKMPAERLEQLKQQKNLNLKIKEQS
jgi:hypothetical protein